MEHIQLERYAVLPHEDSSGLVALGVGADGLLYVVFDREPETRPRRGIFPFSVMPEPRDYLVYRVQDGRCKHLTSIPAEPFNISYVQPVGADQLLLVAARCTWEHGRAEENARLY